MEVGGFDNSGRAEILRVLFVVLFFFPVPALALPVLVRKMHQSWRTNGALYDKSFEKSYTLHALVFMSKTSFDVKHFVSY
jgi:hypothetical protein